LTQVVATATPNSVCTGSSTQLNATITGIPPSGYCTPTYSVPCSSGDYVDNFYFNAIVNNASGCNGNPNNYIYYSNISTTVIPGNTYNMSMQSGSQWA
jgi:hypothetical protein